MLEVKNRKAYFDYFILKEIECGIVLSGTEIKSIRKGSVNLKDTYARIKNDEVFVINMFIGRYEEGNQFNHDERRQRKLLLHKKEITKLNQEIKEQGLTLVPLKLYFKNNHAKLLIGLCKGKKLYDKRETIKKRDLERNERY
jgi:SsrA-binding protein